VGQATDGWDTQIGQSITDPTGNSVFTHDFLLSLGANAVMPFRRRTAGRAFESPNAQFPTDQPCHRIRCSHP
jgi:hypothetical protein